MRIEIFNPALSFEEPFPKEDTIKMVLKENNREHSEIIAYLTREEFYEIVGAAMDYDKFITERENDVD